MSKDLRSSLVEGLEEHFIVRVKDDDAKRNISELLQADIEGNQNRLELLFETERVGRLTITDAKNERHVYAISLHDLPTTVETYKSHNHVNLVKLSDIGQVLTVWPHQEDATVEDVVAELMRLESIKELPLEDEDGVTMPMRQARARVFRKTFDVDPDLVRRVEDQLVSILNGEAPEGWRFEDVEETYVVDKATGKGKWTPSSEVYAAAAKNRKAAPKPKAAPKAKAAKAAKSDDDDVDDESTDSDDPGVDAVEDDGEDEK